jgi:hypothetical protein
MPVFALWSAPRARSTTFLRSMVERGDMVAVREPFCDLAGLGETDVQGKPFDSIHPCRSSPGVHGVTVLRARIILAFRPLINTGTSLSL